MSSYDRDSVLLRLHAAESRVAELEKEVRSLAVRESRAIATKIWHEIRANRMEGHLMFVHDHCGVQEWRDRIMVWIHEDKGYVEES